METNHADSLVSLVEKPVNNPAGLPSKYEYPEPSNHIADSGSLQVPGDFFEFTDYLVPASRILRMCRSARLSKTEDYYSSLLSF